MDYCINRKIKRGGQGSSICNPAGFSILADTTAPQVKAVIYTVEQKTLIADSIGPLLYGVKRSKPLPVMQRFQHYANVSLWIKGLVKFKRSVFYIHSTMQLLTLSCPHDFLSVITQNHPQSQEQIDHHIGHKHKNGFAHFSQHASSYPSQQHETLQLNTSHFLYYCADICILERNV